MRARRRGRGRENVEVVLCQSVDLLLCCCCTGTVLVLYYCTAATVLLLLWYTYLLFINPMINRATIQWIR